MSGSRPVRGLSVPGVSFDTMDATPVSDTAVLHALTGLPPGLVHLPGSAGYEAGRHAFGVSTEPVAVLRPRTTAEASAAVIAAAATGLPFWVKSGGHSHRLGDGLVLDLAEFRDVEPLGDGLVRLGTGSTWRRVMEQLTPHGLVVTSGDTGSVGVGGIVTAGGFGWFVRTVGLTVDQVCSATVVLADGSVERVSAEHRPDLFRAVRGAGGNIGLVTEVVVKALPVETFAAGRLTFEPDTLSAVLTTWREVVRGAPETFNTSFTVGFDLGPPVPAVSFALLGGEDEAQVLLQPLLDLPGLTRVELSTVHYPDLFGPDPEEYPPVRVVGSNGFADLTDDLVAAIAEYHRGGTESEPRWLLLRALGGAYARVGEQDSVLGYRDRELIVLPSVMLPEDADEEAVRSARAASQRVLDHTEGVHSNFTSENDDSVVRRIFGADTLRELSALKQQVDPGWLFRPVHTVPQLQE